MDFRSKLLRTLRAIREVLAEPGVLVIGSEIPNLLENEAASTLIVSEDVDIGVPVIAHGAVKRHLPALKGLRPSADEPSVWVPDGADLLEVNFVGMDPLIRDASETYVLEDPVLPLLVFGYLSFMRPADPIVVDDLSVPVPRRAGLMLEKLVTDRSGVKGDRDLLVVLALLMVSSDRDLEELEQLYTELGPELRHTVRSNLTVLSLLAPIRGMPDPTSHRSEVDALLRRLERREQS